jgi:hypothetical protein
MLLTTALFLATALFGGGLFVLTGKRGMANLDLILAFGGAFIIAMCFLHLVPEAFAGTSSAGLCVLAGFLLQGLLEFLSQGIEHGHFHAHKHGPECDTPYSWQRLPWAALLSLGLHAALESMPVVGPHVHNEGHVHGPLSLELINWRLTAGLILHKVPVAMVLMAMMLEQHVPKRTAWLVLAAFGVSPALGMLSADMVYHSLDANAAAEVTSMLQALVVGILLHIGTTVLFEAGEGHTFNKAKFAATCAGLGLGLLAFV